MGYLYNRRLKKLDKRMHDFRSLNNKTYQTEKLVKTKRGRPVYLVHCIAPEDDPFNGGFIYVLTTKGFEGCLNYILFKSSEERIKIVNLNHKKQNQGLGSQMLNYLDELAAIYGINMIFAPLSPIDLRSHGDRLMHFFEKNGYRITAEKDPILNVKGLIAAKSV